MIRLRFIYLLFLIPVFHLLSGCEQKRNELVWEKSLFQIGSQSSPRTADLNGDGIQDIVIGAGKTEIGHTDQGVIALDGKTGELLWQQEAEAHIVGSATFYDITGDDIADIFIGGRDQHLMALDGSNGRVIWKYEYTFEDHPVLQYARFNFYNSTLLPDQNEDGFPELLTVNGGNWLIKPDSTEGRFPGVLMVMDSKTGEILAADTMPDGKESYMSPVVFSLQDERNPFIIFGSGGETISGNLYLTTLEDLMAQNLGNSRILGREYNHGYIAPPVIADVNGDQSPDIISVSHAGTVVAQDGKTLENLWKKSFSGFESSNALTAGNFNGDDTPDFFVQLSKGEWPQNTTARQILLDGQNGNILFEDSIGCFSLASSVACDLNHDGLEEVIFSTNHYTCDSILKSEEIRSDSVHAEFVYLDFRSGLVKNIDYLPGFKNFFSTPWIGDLDQDGYLDIVYTHYFHPGKISRFMGMQVKRVSTPVRMDSPPRWGGYMGSKGNSIY